MSYKILISIVLLTLFSATYAIDNSVAPHSIAAKSTTPASSAPHKSNVTDPYQYCFNNSTWVVPPQTLLAYLYNTGVLTPASDQTVWVISSYDQGYFSGQSYTAIDVSTLSQKYFMGSVTSEGKVYITFYSGTSSSTDLVSGVGSLNVKSSGQCSFIMQMNSAQTGVSGLAHWSYMIPVNPGDAYYNNLPGTGGMSVPQFLAQF